MHIMNVDYSSGMVGKYTIQINTGTSDFAIVFLHMYITECLAMS